MEQHTHEEGADERALVVYSTCKDLVPVSSRALVDTSAERATDEKLSAEEQELREELEEMEEMLEQANTAIAQFTSDLRKHPSVDSRMRELDSFEEAQIAAQCDLNEVQEEVAKLQDQIARLRTGRSEQPAGDDDEFYWEDEDSIEDRKRIMMEVQAMRRNGADENSIQNHVKNLRKSFAWMRENQVSGAVSNSRNHRRLCKKLYAKIVARTHPDKTSDPDLNELFLRARSLHQREDLDGLQTLWDALQGGNFKRSDLKAVIDRLRARLEEVTEKLAEIMNSPVQGLLRFALANGIYSAQQKYLIHLNEAHARMSATLGMTEAAIFNGRKQIENLKIQIEALQGKRALGIDIVEYKDDDAPDFLVSLRDADSDIEDDGDTEDGVIDSDEPERDFEYEDDEDAFYPQAEYDDEEVREQDEDDNTGDWEQAQNEDGDAD